MNFGLQWGMGCENAKPGLSDDRDFRVFSCFSTRFTVYNRRKEKQRKEQRKKHAVLSSRSQKLPKYACPAIDLPFFLKLVTPQALPHLPGKIRSSLPSTLPSTRSSPQDFLHPHDLPSRVLQPWAKKLHIVDVESFPVLEYVAMDIIMFQDVIRIYC